MFTDTFECLRAEIERLDLLLYRQILRLRATYQLSLDEFRGLYISDEQVDRLINQHAGSGDTAPTISHLTEQAETMRAASREQWRDDLPWKRLVTAFDLSPFEQDVLLLALAPEIDLKYETLYAYLNNDVTRKWPTYDLALRLFSPDTAGSPGLRHFLLPDATLLSRGLVQSLQPAVEHLSWLATGFSLMAGLSTFLLGFPFRDLRLLTLADERHPTIGWDQVPVSENLRATLHQIPTFFSQVSAERPAPAFIFEGRYGSGRTLAAEAICLNLGLPLLSIDLEVIPLSTEGAVKIIQGLLLQQRLAPVGIYIAHLEAWFEKDGTIGLENARLIRRLATVNGPLFLSCAPGTRWREALRGCQTMSYSFGEPDYNERRHLWARYIGEAGGTLSDEISEALATRFILTPGQIKDAAAAAINSQRGSAEPTERLGFDELAQAARSQSDQGLGTLAVKVALTHAWQDVILPPATLRLAKEVAATIKYRHVVYTQWGFERRIASGKGVKVLFAGASGTGKTMTAGVIAKELGVDLYKLDLSGVVSKYIGETEKNLDRIFRAAQSSNAILFFDEADALFGKRSEVKDAHDRYANIEVAYLLQKMEEHEGAVILASNLRGNIDDAFTRRMHYVIEFPLPDEAARERLWRGIFPTEAPLSEDVDIPFLARQFPIAGGDIKNVVLDSAFLAAQDGRVITMKHLTRAMARQMLKQGKAPSPTDFKHYHTLIAQGE